MALSFQKITLEAVEALQEEFGFTIKSVSDALVTLANERVGIDFVYDAGRSNELGVVLSLVSAPDTPFNLDEAYRVLDVPQGSPASSIQSTDLKFIGKHLRSTVETLCTIGARLLEGDPSVFERLAEQRRREAAEYTLSIQIHDTKVIADDAWREKNYRKVIELLTPIYDHLTLADQKRLAFAKKKTL